MTQYSSRLSVPYPTTTDQANISADIGHIATSVLDNAAIYHQTANGSPGSEPAGHTGDIWWCSDATSTSVYYGLNYFDGIVWRNIGPDVVVSTTTPGTTYNGLVYINTTTGVIQLFNNGAWSTVLGYKVPGGATDQQFLQYSAASSGLVWATVPSLPNPTTSGTILQSTGAGTSPIWRNPPSVVAASITNAAITSSSGSTAIASTGSTSGTGLTGFTQYILSVNFDTAGAVGGISGTAGTKPSANTGIIVQFTLTPVSGSTITQRAYAGTVIGSIDGGGAATVAITNAVATNVYNFSVSAATTVSGTTLTAKNGQLTALGVK